MQEVPQKNREELQKQEDTIQVRNLRLKNEVKKKKREQRHITEVHKCMVMEL